MKHIKTPIQIDPGGNGRFIDFDNDDTTFEAVIIVDQDEQICLVPTDLKPQPEQIAAELVTAVNAHDALVEALRRTANNYDIWKAGEAELCWCRGWDFEVWHGCKGEPPCVAAREALALLVEEGV